MNGRRRAPTRLATVRLATVLLGALLLAACTERGGDRREVAIGKPVPAYTATRLDGGLATLDDLRGRVVLLNVWATWCAPCREEIPYLQSLYDRHAADGLEIIGVSVDAAGSESTIREFQQDFRMTYPIWLDPDERVQTLYLALGVPASYLIDRDGILRWKHLGTVRATDTTFTRALAAALGTSVDD
jgi:peroxiredoxin